MQAFQEEMDKIFEGYRESVLNLTFDKEHKTHSDLEDEISEKKDMMYKELAELFHSNSRQYSLEMFDKLQDQWRKLNPIR